MSVTVTVEDGTGLADANAFASVADADAYFATRPRSDDWNAQDVDQKGRLLIHASRILDRSFTWAGEKTSATQALAFPRYSRDFPDVLDGSSIPAFLKDVLFELALILIHEDPTAAGDAAGITGVQVAGFNVNLDPAKIRRFPAWIDEMVSPYGGTHEGSGSARIIRA